MSKSLRICLDLNIWCAALIADAKGRQETACQILVRIVRQGKCSLGAVNLVISWGMLNRLQQVLQTNPKLSVLRDDVVTYTNLISTYAKLSPQLTLGGTGVLPLRDEEDRHVLETSLAGKADILVTANFADFLVKDVQIIQNNQHAIYFSPEHKFHIVHPFLMIKWLNQGYIPNLP
jgi:predicted nucleic acid-binding protein